MTTSSQSSLKPLTAMRTIVAAAGLAPSIFNTQPWRFEIDGSTIELHGDIDKALFKCFDPLGRQLVISCGAALFNMRVTAAYLGRRLEVSLLPDPASATLFARATVGPHFLSRADDAALYPAIRHRHTYRRPFLPRTVPGSIIGELAMAAHTEQAALIVVGKEEREWLFDLVALSEAISTESPWYDEELRRWVGGGGLRHDGIPTGAFGTAPADGSPPMRNLAHCNPSAPIPHERYGPDPCVAVLSTTHDGTLSWLHAGQALQRVLLLGCTRGLGASFLNQPLEVADIRSDLSRFGKPQMILRLGYAGTSPATPRRSLDDLLPSSVAEARDQRRRHST